MPNATQASSTNHTPPKTQKHITPQHNQKSSSLLLMNFTSKTYINTKIKFFQMQIVIQIWDFNNLTI